MMIMYFKVTVNADVKCDIYSVFENCAAFCYATEKKKRRVLKINLLLEKFKKELTNPHCKQRREIISDALCTTGD